jgi:hypothetical protein
MDDQYAKPGDVIEITCHHSDLKGQRITVMECPQKYQDTCLIEGAWHNTRGHPTYFSVGDYVIIKRANSPVAQNVDVDKSLKRQRDDQLRSLFGYDD